MHLLTCSFFIEKEKRRNDECDAWQFFEHTLIAPLDDNTPLPTALVALQSDYNALLGPSTKKYKQSAASTVTCAQRRTGSKRRQKRAIRRLQRGNMDANLDRAHPRRLLTAPANQRLSFLDAR